MAINCGEAIGCQFGIATPLNEEFSLASALPACQASRTRCHRFALVHRNLAALNVAPSIVQTSFEHIARTIVIWKWPHFNVACAFGREMTFDAPNVQWVTNLLKNDWQCRCKREACRDPNKLVPPRRKKHSGAERRESEREIHVEQAMPDG